MDVDDTGLMTALRSLCTSDNESMVKEFIQIVGESKVTTDEAKFYLEMSSWKLADAIGAFYDNGQQNTQYAQFADLIANHQNGSLGMTLLQDNNPDQIVPPNYVFVKRFLLKNTGSLDWPFGSELRFVDGMTLQQQHSFAVPELPVGAEYEICIPLISPSENGFYQSQWKLYTPMDLSFGDSIFCIVNVDQNADPSAIESYEQIDEPIPSQIIPVQGAVNFVFRNDTGLNARPSSPNNDPDEMME